MYKCQMFSYPWSMVFFSMLYGSNDLDPSKKNNQEMNSNCYTKR